MHVLQQRLKHIKARLKQWNKDEFGNIFQDRGLLEQQMALVQQEIMSNGISEDLRQQESLIREQLESRNQQEECLWRQKSRVRWLQEGDRNTRFFHQTTLQRRNHNKRNFMHKTQGDKLEAHGEIERKLTTYFGELLTEPPVDRERAMKEITNNIPRLITEEQNTILMQSISYEEVTEADKGMAAGKAPGPDGFTTDLFQACWEEIGREVHEVAEASRYTGSILKAFNATFIALIPKEQEANSADKLRPISSRCAT